MLSNVKRTTDRKKAYEFVRAQLICKVPDFPRDPTDKELADKLGGTPEIKHDLAQLEDGIADPSDALVAAFKEHILTTEESTINQFLVDPFQEKEGRAN